MAGKLCTGQQDGNAGNVRNSVAFCEGLNARIASNSTTNPHESGSEAADAWDRGVALAAAAAGSTVDPADAGCCAVSQATVPV
jgi:hypothetical protein